MVIASSLRRNDSAILPLRKPQDQKHIRSVGSTIKNLIDQAILDCILRAHKVIAIRIVRYLLYRLTTVVGKDLI